MRDWMHLQLPIESRSRPEPVSVASHADPFPRLPECITRELGSATISRSDPSRCFQVHGRIDRLKRPEMIDPHSAQQDGDEMSGMGEIDENAPSEANFAESTSIVEAQDSIRVTANSGARSRLDKGGGAARGGQHAA